MESPEVRVVFLRHGQTAWNAERRILGRTDVPLDDVGLAQATLVGAALPAAGFRFDAVWSSPLTRARQTAERAGGVAVNGAPMLRVDPDLVEMDQGALEGLPASDLLRDHAELLARWRADPASLVLPGGERMQDVQARGLAALERIVTATRVECIDLPAVTVLVVSHQLVISAVLCALAEVPLARWHTFTHRNTAWSEIRWRPGPGLVAWDVAPHLPAGPRA